MEEKDVITLDVSGCKSLRELHQRIEAAFHFPASYAKNWDSFKKLLWSECDADKIIVLGEKTLSKELDWQIAIMNGTLMDYKAHCEKCEDFVDIEIQG